jgi:trimeric autotransporter adhesin
VAQAQEAVTALVYDARPATDGAAQHAAASEKIINSNNKVVSATERTNLAVEAQGKSLERLYRQIDPAYQAQQRLAAGQALLDRSLQKGAITADEHAKRLDQLKAKYGQVAEASQAGAAAYNAGTAATVRAMGAQNAASASTGKLRAAIGQLGYQVQDAAVQLQGGTSAFVVLAQQGSQAASVFGPMGQIIGAVIALAATAAGVIFGLSDKMGGAKTAANDYGEAMKVAAAASKTLAEGAGVAALALEAERRNVLSLRDAVVDKALSEVAAAQASADAARIQAESGTPEMGLAAGEFERSAVVLNDRYKQIRNELTLLKATYGEFNDGARDHIHAVQNSGKALGDSGKAIDEYNKSLGDTVQQLGLQVDYYKGTDAAKLRAKLTSEALNVQGKAEYDQLSAGTKALIEQAVAYQTKIDALKEATKAGKADLNAHEAGVDAVEDYIAKIRGETEGLGMTDRARAIYAAGLEVERIAKGRLNDDETAKYIEQARKEAGAMYDVKKAHDEAKKAAEEYKRAVEKTADDVVRYSADAFADMIGNGKKTWKDLFATIEKWAIQTAARIAAEMIIRPIVQPVIAGIVGSMPGLFGVSQASASALTGGQAGGGGAAGSSGGMLDLLSAGGKLFTGGSGSLSPGLDAWAQSTFGFGQIGLSYAGAGYGSIAGGAAAELGVAAVPGGVVNAAAGAPGLLNGGSALAGFSSFSNVLGIAGAVLPGLMSGNYVQAAAGGIGAAIGTMILPGIGTAIGGMLGNLAGGLFGKKNGDIPAAQGGVFFGGGKVIGSEATTDNKGDPAVAAQIRDSIEVFGTSLFSLGAKQGADFGFNIETKKGRFEPNIPGDQSLGTLDEALIALTRYQKSQGNLTFADSNVAAAVDRSKATTAEEFVKDIAVAKDFEMTMARMRGGVESASAALDQMRKNADDLGKKGAEQIIEWRDKVLELGLTSRTDIIEPLQNAVRALAGLSDAEEPLTGLNAVTEQVKLNFAALRPVMEEVGFSAFDQQTMYEEMLAKAKKSYNDIIAYTQAQGALAIEQVRDPNARLDVGNTLRSMGMDPEKFGALVESIGFLRSAADAGSDNGYGVARTKGTLDNLYRDGRITEGQYSAGIQLIVNEMQRGIEVADRAKAAQEEAAQAVIAAAEEAKRAQEEAAAAEREKSAAVLAAARATRDFNADLLGRRQTLLGDTNGASMTAFDLRSAQAIEAAQAAGQDVLGLRAVLAAERAQIVYDQAVADYKDGLSRQAAALDEANASLNQNIDLAKGFRAAYNALALSDASPLDSLAKLEEARRQFTAVTAAYNAATDAGEKSNLASQLQALGQRRIELAQGYYASTNSSDYEAVRSLFDQLGVSSETAQTQIEQNQQQIDAIQAAQRAAESIGQRQLGSLESLQQIMNGAKATLDATKAQLAAMPAPIVNLSVNGTTTTTTGAGTSVAPILTPEQQYYAAYADVAKAGVNASQHYAEFGAREGRNRYGLTLTRDQEYLAANADVAAAVVAGAFSSGQQHYDLYGQFEGRKYAQGGFLPAGQIGMAGETGRPELVFGPAYVANPDVTARVMGRDAANDGEVVAELRALRAEVAALRSTTAAGAMQVAGEVRQGNANTADMAATARREAAAPKAA